METGPAIVIGISAVAAVLGVVSFLITRKLYRSGPKSMVSFQLNPERTRSTFDLLFYGHLVASASMMMLAVGAYLEQALVLNTARATLLLYSGVILKVFYDWWRQF